MSVAVDMPPPLPFRVIDGLEISDRKLSEKAGAGGVKSAAPPALRRQQFIDANDNVGETPPARRL
jgi:hypothetical protein